MNTHDMIELPQGYAERPFDYSGDLYTEGQVRAIIEADRKRRGEPVAWRVHPFDYGVGYEGVYAFTSRPDQVAAWERKGWEVQPLFTAPQPAEPVALEPSDAISVVGMPEFDALMDHIYESGTASDGVLPLANALARAIEQAATAPLLARIEELEAKLADAQKDAARLDYVATGKVTVSRDNGGFQLAWYDHNSQKLKWQNSWHETARAAIDAAIKEQQQ